MPEAYRPKGLSSAVCYQDAKAAFRWLEEAFGFEPLADIVESQPMTGTDMGSVSVGCSRSDFFNRNGLLNSAF